MTSALPGGSGDSPEPRTGKASDTGRPRGRSAVAGATSTSQPSVVPLTGTSCRAAEALFAATAEGTTSLLVGPGCERLASFITRLGGRAIAADFAPRGASGSDVPRVQVSAAEGLPFPDAGFDSVFAPLLFSSIPATGDRPDRLAHRMLGECRRVLRPGGTLVIWAFQEPGMGALLRALLRVHGSVGARLLTLPVLDRLARRAKLAGSVSFSPPALEGFLLRQIGFAATDVYFPWPRFGAWEVLAPRADVATQRLLPAKTRVRKVVRGALLTLRAVGAWRWLMPEYCIVATAACDGAAEDQRPPERLLDRLLREAEADALSGPPFALHAQGERVVTFACEDRYFKLPVVPPREERIRDEVRANALVRAEAVRDVAVTYSFAGRVGTVPFLVFPRADNPRRSGVVEQREAIEEAFSSLARGMERLEMRRTLSWARVFSARSRELLGGVGGDPLLSGLEQHSGDRRVPAGTVHGDLNLSHILRRHGRLALIDWDRFEAASPLFLDRCNAVFRWMMRQDPRRRRPERHLLLLERLICRDRSVPLLHRIEEVSGELKWLEMLAFYVLSTGNWRLVQASPSSRRVAEAEVRDQLEICLRHWPKAGVSNVAMAPEQGGLYASGSPLSSSS